MPKDFICKIASIHEMEDKWDNEIAQSGSDKLYLTARKQQNIERYRQGNIIPYYGILDGKSICEATAMLSPDVVQNSADLVGEKTVYLSAFKTVDSFQGKGSFSALFQFIIEDLSRKGYSKATLGVEISDKKNKAIYDHFGFTEYIKFGIESYPDCQAIAVEYYGKHCKRKTIFLNEV